MSMLQFIPYKVQPVKLARDPLPSYYIPIRRKFPHLSTTKETFRGERGEPVVSMKPREASLRVEKTESMNMNTNYRDTFVPHGLSLCQSKAFLIAQSFANKNRDERPQTTTANSNQAYELTNLI